MFCSRCGSESTDSAVFCSKCGQELAGSLNESAPATPSTTEQAPPPVVVNANPYGTPGTGALWLSIFGFVCGIPALLGIIFGIAAYKEANRRGVSSAKATWAIVIGIAWFVPLIFVVTTGTLGGILGESSDSASTSTVSKETPESKKERPGEPPSKVSGLSSDLINMGFECDGPRGDLQRIQCSKGQIETEAYGTQPVQMINIELATERVHGYARPKPIAKVGEYVPVQDFGDTGDDSGVRYFG